MCARCASARAPALYAPCARCPSSLLLAAALARLEHLFSPSPWLSFLPFARSLVPRDPNICSPHRLSCPSRSSCARLCRRATRTPVLPVAPVAFPAFARSPAPRDSNICSLHRPGCLSCSSCALARWLACPRRARHLPADYRRAARARRLSTAWAWACAGAGMCQGYL